LHIFIKMTAKLGQIHLLQNIIYSINQKVLEDDQEGLKSEIEQYKIVINKSNWIGNEILKEMNKQYKKALEGRIWKKNYSKQ